MKKIVKILLGVALMLIGVSNVNAAKYTTGDTLSITEESYYFVDNKCDDCYYNSEVGGYDDRTHFIRYEINDGHAAYCLDPQNKAASSLKVKNVITTESSDFNGYYAGLIAIGMNGYSKNNTSGYGVSGDKYYAATTMAVRMFTLAMGNGKTTAAYEAAGAKHNYTLSNTAALWCSQNASIAQAALGSRCSNCKTASDFWKSFGLSGTEGIKYNNSYNKDVIIKGGSDKAVLEAAKSMFIEGLEAASEFNKSNSMDIGTSSAKLSTTQTLASKTSSTTNTLIRKDYYTLALKNFTTNDNVNSLSVECKNCNQVAGNPTIAITGYSTDGGKTFNNGIPSDGVLSKFTGDANIILEITGTVKLNSGYDCTDIKYDIKYNFKSASANYEIYILGNGANNYQRFYAIVTDGANNLNGLPQTETRTMDYCANDKCAYYDPKDFEQMTEEEFEDYTEDCCTDLESYCEDNNNANRDYYCDLYSEYCGACDTEIVIPQVCTYIDGEDGEAVAEDMTGYVKSAVDEDGKSNIKACLLMRKKDEAGNSYKAMENSYCKVYCKEDYSFNLPTAVSINSGTYFQLDATVTGTKTCYTSEIDTEKFKNDISALNSSSNAYKEKVAEYNACINMEVDYDCFDPEIEYEYEEIYNDQLGSNDKFVQSGSLVETNKNTTYCNSDINDDYSCKDSSTKVASNIDGVAFTTKYVKSTVTKTGVYTTPSVFYTQHPSGTITTDKNAENATLINGLPVSVNTEKGRHKFTLNITNLGEYYGKSSCENGRIVGGENSILDKQVKNGLNTTSEYMCYYDVNCPECEFECEGPLCDLDFCDGDECTATCLGNGCAYDTGAGLSYAYRTITLGSLNPNGRNLGYNWNPTNSVKARETIDEIETNGETAYEEAEYSFTLTPALISEIKEYNRTKLNDGGYADQSLTCKADKFGNENVNCESDFITKLVKGDIGTRNNNVVVPNAADKFTSWLESDYCNGTCTITKGSGIGPSWK